MSNNVKNFFEHPVNSSDNVGDNILHLGGTVVGQAGTQAAFVANATDLATAITLANALKAIAIDTGFMAPS